LLLAAGLFTRTFQQLARVQLGFDQSRVLTVTITAPTVPAADRSPLYHRLVRAVATIPGVAAVGGALGPPPLFPPLVDQMLVTGAETLPRSEAERLSRSNMVTPGWFRALGVPLRAGRDFDEHDTIGSPPVMIVNDAFVRRFLPNRPPVGASVMLAYPNSTNGPAPLGSWEVVGVVGDAVFASIREPLPPTLYLALAQRGGGILLTNFYLVVRAGTGSPVPLTRSVAAGLTQVNHDLTLAFRPLGDQVRASLAHDRLLASLSGFFGALGLLLAALGLYGVVSYAVARSRAEIGIRMAIGATPAGVIRLVMRRVFWLVATGLGIGIGISLWASQFVAFLLYGLAPRDPVTLMAAVCVLTAVAAMAGGLPAWRASRIDPAEVLRDS
jgi:predicted permease